MNLVILGSYYKSEDCGQILLPDRSFLVVQKLLENAKNKKLTIFGIFSNVDVNVARFARNVE